MGSIMCRFLLGLFALALPCVVPWQNAQATATGRECYSSINNMTCKVVCFNPDGSIDGYTNCGFWVCWDPTPEDTSSCEHDAHIPPRNLKRFLDSLGVGEAASAP